MVVAGRLGRLLTRTFVEPVWTAGPTKVEAWPCPTCGREVVRLSPAVKGIWVAPTAAERTALCARQHGAHGRLGTPLPIDEDELVVDWVPVVALEDGAFLALVPPAGLRCTPADGGGYAVSALDEVNPSDLVGHPTATHGRTL